MQLLGTVVVMVGTRAAVRCARRRRVRDLCSWRAALKTFACSSVLQDASFGALSPIPIDTVAKRSGSVLPGGGFNK